MKLSHITLSCTLTTVTDLFKHIHIQQKWFYHGRCSNNSSSNNDNWNNT